LNAAVSGGDISYSVNAIAIGQAGYYEISYDVSGLIDAAEDPDSSTVTTFAVQLYGTSELVPGSISDRSTERENYSYDWAATTIAHFNSGDIIYLVGKQVNGTNTNSLEYEFDVNRITFNAILLAADHAA